MGKKRGRRDPIHESIKKVLGYPDGYSDDEVRRDWTKRTSTVCKPCWELKYCPYGPFVEQSPLLPTLRDAACAHHIYLKRVLESGFFGEIRPIDDKERIDISNKVTSKHYLIQQAKKKISERRRLESAMLADDPLTAFLGGELPPIEEYRVPFEVHSARKPGRAEVSEAEQSELRVEVEAEKQRLSKALETGTIDDRTPLDSIRRRWFSERVDEFDPSKHPEAIPESFREASCNVFGHICPVFFTGEEITETTEARRRTRYIPFKVKIRVTRRDNYTCQECSKTLKDNELEFDHIIPISKGGSSEEHNIRLVCFDCNREKSDNLEI